MIKENFQDIEIRNGKTIIIASEQYINMQVIHEKIIIL